MSSICREVLEEVCILANGDVVCSCTDPDGQYVAGNVRETPILEIFHGPKYRALRRILLNSADGAWCPALGCSCPSKCVQPPEGLDPENPADLTIRKIRLETISYCNLRCPACKIVEWRRRQGATRLPWRAAGASWRRPVSMLRRSRRADASRSRLNRLPLDAIHRVLHDTRDTLRSVWLYNYGEPFLDRRFLDILRFARKTVPGLRLYTHTNGTVIPAGWPRTIVEEELLDHISFSIDGASQETYARYRVGGDFDKAFANMLEFVRTKERLGRAKPNVTWQYILFEWNDSPEELARAQELAVRHGVELLWLVTHTKGKSRRLTADSDAYQELLGIKHYSGRIQAERIDQERSSAKIA